MRLIYLPGLPPSMLCLLYCAPTCRWLELGRSGRPCWYSSYEETFGPFEVRDSFFSPDRESLSVILMHDFYFFPALSPSLCPSPLWFLLSRSTLGFRLTSFPSPNPILPREDRSLSLSGPPKKTMRLWTVGTRLSCLMKRGSSRRCASLQQPLGHSSILTSFCLSMIRNAPPVPPP